VTELKVKTRWGKRRGWEIQHFMVGTKHFYRVTGRGWCHMASPQEIQMWRVLKKLRPEDFKVSK